VSLSVQAKQPGERLVSHSVELDVNFERALGARQDSVEHAWRVVQPLLDYPGPVHHYRPGS
jgi:glucose-6-phosphate 1-dehydrogenase